MRKKLIAGNWKMNSNMQTASALADSISRGIKSSVNADIVLCPPFIFIQEVKKAAGNAIQIGAQNLFYEDEGAYTGEISANMLKSSGCEYVIIGHSERRQYFSETNIAINKKIKRALSSELIPIVCVGETLDERDRNIQFEVVEEQLSECMKDLNIEEFCKIIIAYEPVWAIGTGRNATPAQANEMHLHIRNFIKRLTNPEAADCIRIIYGGSMNDKNAAELLAQPEIDGGLVGGASLDSEKFLKIISSININTKE